ncbi:MAG: preprotein translocase subunit SecG [Rhodospirillales bacterium]
MTTVIIVIHLILAIALVGVILLQRSEGGGLGMGGGGGGMGGFMTGRATANLLTRATAIIAALFMLTSLTLAILAGGERESRSILDQPPAPVEQEPAKPEGPSAPLAR